MNKPALPPLPRPRNGLQPNAPSVISWPLADQSELPETRGSGHIHWGITAFHHMDEEGTFQDSCSIEVEADDEVQAIARAQQLIQRANYRVSWVREICTKDTALKEEK